MYDNPDLGKTPAPDAIVASLIVNLDGPRHAPRACGGFDVRPEVEMSATVRVWDLPRRVVHWNVVASALGLAITSPLGALSVFAMLSFPAVQVATGLISDNKIDTSGSLAKWVRSALVSSATLYHRRVGKVALLVLIPTHIRAIAYYRFKNLDPLVPAMLHGDRPIDQPKPGSPDDRISRLGVLVIYLLCALAVWPRSTVASAQP